jgi:ethanolamine utilization protein EutA
MIGSHGHGQLAPDPDELLSPDAEDAARQDNAFLGLDNIELKTVGIDVGSSTSHLTFSEVHLQRLGGRLSSRFVPVERRIVYESEIILTPYLSNYTIDAIALGRFVQEAYAAAGVDRHGIDTGAVILTGEAAKRHNAAAISEMLAAVAGDFVCATAGHRLEAMIAAHGSGAVAASRERSGRVLNVDVGGGTTKFAVIDDGVVVATGALSVGGRLIATSGPRVNRAEPAGIWFADRLGIDVDIGETLVEADRRRLGEAMADVIVDCMIGREAGVDPSLWVTPELRLAAPPEAYSFSGGVARYVHDLEDSDYGDLGGALGSALRARLQENGAWSRVLEPRETIRATVIGASQYTIQVSGNTVFVPDPTVLPLHNLKVVACAVPGPDEPDEGFARALRDAMTASDLSGAETFAFAIHWRGRPFYPRMRALAEAIVAESPRGGTQSKALVLIFDSDVGQSIGEIMRSELGWTGPVVCLDAISVGAFDFVDVGHRLEPSGTFPVVVKSLMFPASTTPGVHA